jgi:hypothetical protein
MKKFENVLIIFAVSTILTLAAVLSINEERDKKVRAIKVDTIMIPDAVKSSRGYDYEKKDYIWYTDEEIRTMRRENPRQIIRAPGRYVPSDQELFEERMEQYIEDNHDEIIERYKD